MAISILKEKDIKFEVENISELSGIERYTGGRSYSEISEFYNFLQTLDLE